MQKDSILALIVAKKTFERRVFTTARSQKRISHATSVLLAKKTFQHKPSQKVTDKNDLI
jgi:hypothetical protein